MFIQWVLLENTLVTVVEGDDLRIFPAFCEHLVLVQRCWVTLGSVAAVTSPEHLPSLWSSSTASVSSRLALRRLQTPLWFLPVSYEAPGFLRGLCGGFGAEPGTGTAGAEEPLSTSRLSPLPLLLARFSPSASPILYFSPAAGADPGLGAGPGPLAVPVPRCLGGVPGRVTAGDSAVLRGGTAVGFGRGQAVTSHFSLPPAPHSPLPKGSRDPRAGGDTDTVCRAHGAGGTSRCAAQTAGSAGTRLWDGPSAGSSLGIRGLHQPRQKKGEMVILVPPVPGLQPRGCTRGSELGSAGNPAVRLPPVLQPDGHRFSQRRSGSG